MENTHDADGKGVPFLVEWQMIQVLTGKCERSCRSELADMKDLYNTPRPNIYDMADYYHTSPERLKQELKEKGYFKYIKKNIY